MLSRKKRRSETQGFMLVVMMGQSRIHVGGYDGPTMLITPRFPHEKKSL
jgi:hypothetical protein